MCFEGELPVKPQRLHYAFQFKWDNAISEYNQAIATLKSKALVVANQQICPQNMSQVKEGELILWPGTVEKIHKTNCGKINECTYKDCNDAGHCTLNEEVYILHLPKPKKIHNNIPPLPEYFYIEGPDEFVKGEPVFNNGGQIPAYGNERTARQLIAELKEENTRLRKLIEDIKQILEEIEKL